MDAPPGRAAVNGVAHLRTPAAAESAPVRRLLGQRRQSGHALAPGDELFAALPGARRDDRDTESGRPGHLSSGVNNAPGPNGAVYDPASPSQIASIVAQERDMAVHRESLEVNYTFDSGITFRSLSSNIVMDRKQVEGGDSRQEPRDTGHQRRRARRPGSGVLPPATGGKAMSCSSACSRRPLSKAAS
jgi:hypothetical protein